MVYKCTVCTQWTKGTDAKPCIFYIFTNIFILYSHSQQRSSLDSLEGSMPQEMEELENELDDVSSPVISKYMYVVY